MTAWSPARSDALLRRPVLALNFHLVAPETRSAVREQLRRAAGFGPSFLDDPAPQHDGPSVLVAFYDGYRESSLFGAEECARLGLRAVFFPVTAGPDPSHALLTDDELADIAGLHELGFHTAGHRASHEVGPEDVEDEVVEPVRWLTELAGRPPRIGAWRGGARFDPGRPGEAALQRLGLRWWVSNWSVEDVPPLGHLPRWVENRR